MGTAGTSGVPSRTVSRDLSEYERVRQWMRSRGMEHFGYVANLKAHRLVVGCSGTIAWHVEGDHQQQTRRDAMKSLPARDCDPRIPENISIIRFDDISQASLDYPRLTTARQSLEQMGQRVIGAH